MLTPPSLQPTMYAAFRNEGDRLFNCETLRAVSSGEMSAITTEDPQLLSLPSFELLQLQLLLHHVFALVTTGYGTFGFGTEALVYLGSVMGRNEDI